MEIAMRLPALLACALLAAAPLAYAQSDYPSRPVRIIVPFPPGGAADTLARIYGQRMSEDWKQPVIVENRPGAGGIIGTEAAAKAAPDGYTLLVVTVGHAVNASLMPKLPYDTAADLAPVALLATLPSLVVVNPGLPAKDVKDLIALAKAKPGSITYASSGTGSTSHMSAALLASMAGVSMVHVPYKGASAALNDVMGGQVQMTIDVAVSAVPQVKAGKLRALAITSAKRSSLLPDLPTLAESGVPGYEFTAWYAMLAPAKTPASIVDKVSGEAKRIAGLPEVKEKLNALGAEPASATPAETGALVKSEMQRWAKLIKEQNIKVE
jgi:tripartite-type tricarboxylate transporter receptor subunit TctC